MLEGHWCNVVRGREEFKFGNSLFADDGAFLFISRAEMCAGMQVIFDVFLRFGMRCHVGTGKIKSKTEAAHFPHSIGNSNSADLSSFEVGDGIVTIASEFRYLGSILHKSLRDDTDVESRIRSAGAAFGALRKS